MSESVKEESDKTLQDDEFSGSEPEVLSHQELLEITQKTLTDVLKRDPLLSDLPSGVTLEEVQSQIALEHGQSMTVFVVRDDGEEMPVVVQQQGATVLDLKRAIRRYFTLKLTRYQRSSVNISWRYIWRVNWLVHEGSKLKDDNALLADIGIRNKSYVSFVKRLGQRRDPR
ncbi:U11/U12 small nuclear ribonucleoprotein 25 kDa protein [Cryptotermes secundus]|nr:U11/U12 small nuclear ribonucleoprotein 25 kDa protein [Cryptotermes secundus]XP_023714844.1 U11/U12 small nuclear ribonucleoprotein 25 kDa protein [Cryptotermes secundus]XP_023714845.1 U11/U12 small nuclear ribonucleoprotein 25 kDa protein [Cryptotermes secundus]XP_033608944.1 U11/U12 small nuclear ribonucleoprotein 25 kDa protein [Cryptotermes secundus]